jgi:NAD(P)-dependent dehydrogenase (short-subunit alcohol dehydrogenase family)
MLIEIKDQVAVVTGASRGIRLCRVCGVGKGRRTHCSYRPQ